MADFGSKLTYLPSVFRGGALNEGAEGMVKALCSIFRIALEIHSMWLQYPANAYQ